MFQPWETTRRNTHRRDSLILRSFLADTSHQPIKPRVSLAQKRSQHTATLRKGFDVSGTLCTTGQVALWRCSKMILYCASLKVQNKYQSMILKLSFKATFTLFASSRQGIPAPFGKVTRSSKSRFRDNTAWKKKWILTNKSQRNLEWIFVRNVKHNDTRLSSLIEHSSHLREGFLSCNIPKLWHVSCLLRSMYRTLSRIDLGSSSQGMHLTAKSATMWAPTNPILIKKTPRAADNQGFLLSKRTSDSRLLVVRVFSEGVALNDACLAWEKWYLTLNYLATNHFQASQSQ